MRLSTLAVAAITAFVVNPHLLAAAVPVSDSSSLPLTNDIDSRSTKHSQEDDCDAICRGRFLYYTTYASATTALTMVMESHNAWDWCTSRDNESWCPQLVNSTASNIAQRLVHKSPVTKKHCDAACFLEELEEKSQHAAHLSAKWATRHLSKKSASKEDLQALGRVMDDLARPPKKPLFDHDELRKALAADESEREDDDGDDSPPQSPKASAIGAGMDLTTSFPLAKASELLMSPFLPQSCTSLAARSPGGSICDPANLKYPGRSWDTLLRGRASNFIRRLLRARTTGKMGSSRTWFNRFLRSIHERDDGASRAKVLDPTSRKFDPDTLRNTADQLPPSSEHAQQWPEVSDVGSTRGSEWFERPDNAREVWRAETFDAETGRIYQRVYRPNLRVSSQKKLDNIIKAGYRAFEELDRSGNPIRNPGARQMEGYEKYTWAKPENMKLMKDEDWIDFKNKRIKGQKAPQYGKESGSKQPVTNSLGEPVVKLGDTEFADVRPQRKRVNTHGQVDYLVFTRGTTPKEVGEMSQQLDGAMDLDLDLCSKPPCHADAVADEPKHTVEDPEHKPSHGGVVPVGAHHDDDDHTSKEHKHHTSTKEHKHHTSTKEHKHHTSTKEHTHSKSAKHTPTTFAIHAAEVTESPLGTFVTLVSTQSTSTDLVMHYAQAIPTTTELEMHYIQAAPTSTEMTMHYMQQAPTSTEVEMEYLQAAPTSTEEEVRYLQAAPTTTEEEMHSMQAAPASTEMELEKNAIRAVPTITDMAILPVVSEALAQELPVFTTTIVTWTWVRTGIPYWVNVEATLSAAVLPPRLTTMYSTSRIDHGKEHDVTTLGTSTVVVMPTTLVVVTKRGE